MSIVQRLRTSVVQIPLQCDEVKHFGSTGHKTQPCMRKEETVESFAFSKVWRVWCKSPGTALEFCLIQIKVLAKTVGSVVQGFKITFSLY